jgi:hypothetical protein
MNRHPVDAFLMKTFEERGLRPAPRAEPTTLVRRASGPPRPYPPTPSEVAEFVNDRSRPRLGETHRTPARFRRTTASDGGRHWLDVARYADSNGYEHDYDRPNAWRYRDYVIKSFKPRHSVQTCSCASRSPGDELEWVSNDSLIATGFLRNHAKSVIARRTTPSSDTSTSTT